MQYNAYQPNYYQPTPHPYYPNQQVQQVQSANNYSVPSLPGRPISSGENIAPNEVPMDGRVGYFPQSDGSCIYAKAWSADGTIKTIKYCPELTKDASKDEEDNDGPTLSDVMQRLDNIEKKLSSRQRSAKGGNNA